MDHAPSAIDPAPVVSPTFMPRPRRGRGAVIGWVVAAVAVIAIGTAGASVHIAAHRSFDDAAAKLQLAIAHTEDSAELLGRVTDDGAETVAAAEAILAAADDELVGIEARAEFDGAAAMSSTAVQSADDLLAEPVRAPSTAKPLWTWELWQAVPRLEAGAADLVELGEALQEAGDVIDDADEELLAAADALYSSSASAAADLEDANVSARNLDVLDFRDAAAAVAAQRLLGPGSVYAFQTYAEAAAALAASTEAELAEKAGPLLATRLEIEAFARSIAGGVLLDFDWAQVVNGREGSEWMSGNATWKSSRGGYSTITFSNTVAENWPTANAKALVAHEVGHAITAKCGEMFDSDDRASNEAWATAWAISMGHTAEGNGVQAYGYPPQDLIDIASTCR